MSPNYLTQTAICIPWLLKLNNGISVSTKIHIQIEYLNRFMSQFHLVLTTNCSQSNGNLRLMLPLNNLIPCIFLFSSATDIFDTTMYLLSKIWWLIAQLPSFGYIFI